MREIKILFTPYTENLKKHGMSLTDFCNMLLNEENTVSIIPLIDKKMHNNLLENLPDHIRDSVLGFLVVEVLDLENIETKC